MPSDDITLSLITQRLQDYTHRTIPLDGLEPAAVLLVLHECDEGLCAIFTVRTHDVEHHKGEISLPGGRMDDDDADERSAALRETMEEVGIRSEHLTVLGTLDECISISGYRVTPFVAKLSHAPYSFTPEPREVSEILTIPLAHLRDPKNHRVETYGGADHPIHHYQWKHHVVWGLTGHILHHFLEVVAPSSEAIRDDDAPIR